MIGDQYRVRALKQKRGQSDQQAANFVITIPAEIGRKIVGRKFTFQLTEKGMLYSLLPDDPEADNRPRWLYPSP